MWYFCKLKKFISKWLGFITAQVLKKLCMKYLFNFSAQYKKDMDTLLLKSRIKTCQLPAAD